VDLLVLPVPITLVTFRSSGYAFFQDGPPVSEAREDRRAREEERRKLAATCMIRAGADAGRGRAEVDLDRGSGPHGSGRGPRRRSMTGPYAKVREEIADIGG